MKVKAIVFGKGNYQDQRFVPGFQGMQFGIRVGQECIDPQGRGKSVVSSLELDRTARLVLVRRQYAEGDKQGQPYRLWTCNTEVKPWDEADALAVAYGDDVKLIMDDEPAAQPQGKGK